jgi:hypothetical protein
VAPDALRILMTGCKLLTTLSRREKLPAQCGLRSSGSWILTPKLITDLLITFVLRFLLSSGYTTPLEHEHQRPSLQLCLVGVAQHAGKNELARLVVDYRE